MLKIPTIVAGDFFKVRQSRVSESLFSAEHHQVASWKIEFTSSGNWQEIKHQHFRTNLTTTYQPHRFLTRQQYSTDQPTEDVLKSLTFN